MRVLKKWRGVSIEFFEVFHDLQKREQIRYCVHPDWWGILFELLSDLDNIVKMVGGSSSYEEIVKLVKSGIEGNRAEVSAAKIDKLRDIKTVISNQYSVNHADIVVRELRKAVQYGIAGITDVKLRKALSNVYKGALQLMGEQEFWEGLLAMYMYCSTYSNYNRYFKGSSDILICSENYFFYIVERAIGRRWTYEDNHFYKEVMHDFYEILEIVKEDLNRGLQNEMNLKQENADRLSEFFDDLEKLGFSVIGGRGLLKEIRIEIEGPGNAYSQSGLDYIKSWEKCSLTSYDAKPGEGDWTIGWGRKLQQYNGQPNNPNITITQQQADEWFQEDIQKMLDTTFTTFLKDNNITLTSNQFDAMLSFTFNYGENSWAPKGMTKMKDFLIKGDFSEQAAKAVFQDYIDMAAAKGNQAGNIQRRKDELEMFLYGTYNYHN